MDKDPEQSLEILRQRYCAEGTTASRQSMEKELSLAREHVASMASDGAWSDIDYGPGELYAWPAMTHLQRLLQIANVHYLDDESQADDERVSAILLGLNYWYNQDLVNPNWWHNQIGAPQILGEILLRIKPSCPGNVIERAIPAFLHHQPAIRFTGQNLVWVANIQVRHGILVDDPDLVSLGLKLIDKEIRVLPHEEGLQPDMSFYQHGLLLYSGGYGQAFAMDLARIAWITHGTAYAMHEDKLGLLSRYILDGSRWMIRGTTFDYGAVGREISRAKHSNQRLRKACRYLSEMPTPRQGEFEKLARISKGQSLVRGNRCFWCSDLMTQHRSEYYLSVRVTSNRILNNDMPCCGGEGRICHHMADGATFILVDGDEYRDIFPVWDWRKIPGTTAVQSTGDSDPDRLRKHGGSAFAGGVSDGDVGCMAMDFVDYDLSMRKAWFLFDECMVALGAGIHSDSSFPVRTTLNQCHLRGDVVSTCDQQVLPCGQHEIGRSSLLWHDQVTYGILDGTGSLSMGEQTGAWSDCGVGSGDQVTLPVLSLGLDHGVMPEDARYAYVVYSGEPREQSFSRDLSEIGVVRNDIEAQAVWHHDQQRGHIVFYQPDALVEFPDGQRLSADMPCIIMYNPRQENVELTIAQPEHKSGLLTIRLTGRRRCTIGLSLPEHDNRGASIQFVAGSIL